MAFFSFLFPRIHSDFWGRNNEVNLHGSRKHLVFAQRGDDTVFDSGGRHDFVRLGKGDDRMVLDGLDGQARGLNRYDGGRGHDTFEIRLSLDEWLAIQTSLRVDLKALSHQIDAGRDRRWFEFDSLNVKVREFEALRLVVDGKEISWEDSPVSAVNDRIRVSEDRVARGSVLENDDIGDPLDAVTLISGPSRGVLKLRDDGTFRFKAAGSFDELALGEVAKEVFKYRVTDIDGDSDTARGKIRIVGKNDAPVMAAGEMSAIVDEGGQPLDLTALGSDVDSDDDGATLIYTITGAPAEGQAWLDGADLYFETDGDMQDLASGETRDVFVEVTATDRHGASATGLVRVTVESAEEPVEANADTFVFNANVASFSGSVVANDVIPNELASVVLVGDAPAGGAFELRNDGTFSYVPATDLQSLALGQVSPRTFDYELTGSLGGKAQATATLQVVGVNDAPTMSDGALTAIDSRDDLQPRGAFVIDLSTLGRDIDDDESPFTLTYEVSRGPLFGNAWVEGSDLLFQAGSTLRYLDVGRSETLDLEVMATDQHGASATSTITITIEGSDQAPVAYNDSFTVPEDEVGTFDVLANDTIIDFGDTFELVRAYGAQNGKVAVDNGHVVYTPDADFNGSDRFFYQIEDSDGLTATANASVYVEGRAEAPTISYKTVAGFTPNRFQLMVTAESTEFEPDPDYPNNLIDRFELTATDPDGNPIDIQQYVSIPEWDNPFETSEMTFTFQFLLPETGTTEFDVHIEAIAKDAKSGHETSATETYEVGFSTTRTESVETFTIQNQSIWDTGNRFEAQEVIGGTFDESGIFGQKLVEFDSRVAGVGVTTAFSTQMSGGAEGSIGLTATAGGQGGEVSGEMTFNTRVTTGIDRNADTLSFRTFATPDKLRSDFTATTPNLDFDLSLTDLALSAEFAAVIWGYVHFHTGVNTIKPVDRGNIWDGWGFDADVDLNANPLLGPGGLSLINFDGTQVSALEGLRKLSDLNGTFVDYLGNALFDYDLRDFTGDNVSDVITGSGLFGENSGQIGNLTLDLDSIAASLLGRKNPLGQVESESQGPVSYTASYDLLDLDLVMPVHYRQANSLDMTKLKGGILFEGQTEAHEFIFGDRFTFENASSLDANGDGDIQYQVLMTPEAAFNSDAYLDMSTYDRLQVLAATLTGGVNGGTYYGVSTPGFSLGSTVGPAFSQSRSVVDEATSFLLEQSSIQLAMDTVVSETFLL